MSDFEQDFVELTGAIPVVGSHVRCVRCRYDLAGASALGRCPECGLEIVVTLAQHTDPAVSDLARPQRPQWASAGVLAIAIGPFAAVCIQGVSPALRFLDSLTGRGAAFPLQVERPAWLAAGIVLFAAAAVATYAFSNRVDRTARASAGKYLPRALAMLWLWAAVLLTGFACSLLPPMQLRSFGLVVLAAQLLPATLFLSWVGRALGRLGVQSRAYREARHGRQSSELVTVTLAGSITMGMIRPALGPLGYGDLEDIAGILSLVLIALSVLGLAYMVANAWVISAALRAPRIDVRRFE